MVYLTRREKDEYFLKKGENQFLTCPFSYCANLRLHSPGP